MITSAQKHSLQSEFKFLQKNSRSRQQGFTLRLAKQSRTERGFTLIEILIATAVLAIVSAVVFGTIANFFRISQLSQDTIRAQHLANQKMEELRNMPYDSLSTQFGAIYPPGTILDSQTVTVGKNKYVVQIVINYVDDPFDGNAAGTIAGKPRDFYPYDYKKVSVKVKNYNQTKYLAQVSTNIAAKAAETASNTGILSLTVLDSQGQPLSDANVHLTNPTPNPDVDIQTTTDASGLVLIPALPPDSNKGYHLVVSLPGYSTSGTLPAFAPNNQNPVIPDFNILAQQITSLTISIDRLSTMQIHVQNTLGAAVPNLALGVTGSKLNYTNPDQPKYTSTSNSNASGNLTLANIEWDSYSITVPFGYYIINTIPYQKINLLANTTQPVTVVVSIDPTYPRVSSVSPISSTTNTTQTLTITGANLLLGASVQLKMAGQPTINATAVTSSLGNTQLTANIDLTLAAVGNWDVVVSDLLGRSVTQTGGFTVTP